ncbi:MAG TPA: hypothetical protein PLN86_16865 [Candidatus Hydrogenedentes bacterium]|nr:hypothetical protein [Candidatus Hydrogenedentota bacterium]
MLIQQVIREPEVVQIIVKNVDGSGSITTGLGVALVGAGASIDGVSATKYAAANVRTFAGVAAEDIPINGYGRVTAWGLAQSVAISNVGTSITITRGDTLKPGAVAGTFFSSLASEAISTLLYKYVVAASTPVAISTGSQSYCHGIVRAL